MKLLPLPALTDNYIWMLHDGQRALVVDPGEAYPVKRALEEAGLQLQAILITHHHHDHIDGVPELIAETGAVAYGPGRENIPEPFEPLVGGDSIQVLGIRFQVLDVPGHTAGHIAYFAEPTGQGPLLFCGDTLFSAGCGRLFEGTPAQMLASLDQLAALPANTRVCCTHEYTLSNLRFARAVEPDNPDLLQHTRHCEALRASKLPTLPSSMELELAINPFLRSRQDSVVRSVHSFDASATGETQVFAALREWKNQFR